MTKQLTKNVDKMARHLSKKMNDVKEIVEDSQKSNKELTVIILESQLEELKGEKTALEEDIEKLKYELPQISSECDRHFGCQQCSNDPKCGWCNMEQRCVEGDNVGPLYVSCSFYNYKYCSGAECGAFTDCNVN